MSDFGYVNARLRSLRAQRLAPSEFDTLLGFEQIREFGDWLSSGPYGEAYGKVVEHSEGLKAADAAISERLRSILEACIKMVSIDAESPLGLYLARTDYENIKVAVRAVLNGTGFEEAKPAFVPLPPLDFAALERLCEAEDLQGVARLLMTWGHPAGKVVSRFLRLEGDPEHHRLDALDRALEDCYFAEAIKSLDEEEDEENEPLRDAIQDEADLANLRAALKVAYSGGGEIPSKPFPQGRVKRHLLDQIAECRNLSDAVELLEQTVYRRALLEGAGDSAKANDLGGLERHLEHVRLTRLARGGITDPTGIGFTLLFLAEAFLEAQNLRLVARVSAGIIPATTAQEVMIHV